MKIKIIKRPWGKFEQFSLNEKSTVKILTIKSKQELSLQSHKKRDEVWKIIEGNVIVTIGKKDYNAKKGDSFLIKRNKSHQLKAKNKKVCVLGNTGGGRDTWKRPVMAQVAEKYCDEIILTNEDPYDEDPQKIIDEMKKVIKNKPVYDIMDRRAAIKTAIKTAKKLGGDSVVLISGKGTDPYIMEENNKKTPWSDFEVAKEELQKLLIKK